MSLFDTIFRRFGPRRADERPARICLDCQTCGWSYDASGFVTTHPDGGFGLRLAEPPSTTMHGHDPSCLGGIDVSVIVDDMRRRR